VIESRSIQGVLIVIVVTLLAAWLGVAIVTEQTVTLLKVGGVSLLAVCLLLGRRIWLLSILFAALNVPLIRGFGTTELGQGLFIAFSTAIFMLRRLPLKLSFGELEVWMLLLAACIIQVYLRNPVGLNMFGAGSVGARPYFMAAMAWASGLLLGSLVVPPSEIRWAMRLTILGGFAGVFLTTLRMRVLGGGEAPSGIASSTSAAVSGRISSFGFLGGHLSRVVASFVSPIRGCFHPLWAPLILISLAAAAASGYRNAVASVGITYLIGIAYRGGIASLFVAFVSGAVGLAMLALVNLASPLPPNIQRALSPFPGTWEKRHVEVAEASTQWRVEMWKEALFTDYWIHNKLLGDGLGFTRRELEMLETFQENRTGFASMNSGLSTQQETMMLTGGYHSGPVQTVRTVGYVGLVILLLAMIRTAIHAHRQIQRCRGTEWYPVAMLLGLPAIILPFMFILIFGEFGSAVASVCASYGIIRLMEKNLPLPAFVRRRPMPYVLQRRNAPMIEAQRQPN
jgi:hypothetical protein